MICDRRSATVLWLVALVWVALSGCDAMTPKPPLADPMEEVSVFVQGDKLFASVRLRTEFLNAILRELDNGEPIMATYRFRFYRLQNHFPDLRLSQQTIQRRLRRRLITERFEMTELPQKRLHYTPDEDEAMNFLGSPRYILLGSDVHLPRTNRYYLDIGITIEHQEMSWVLSVLNRWLTLTPPVIYRKHVRFQHP
ncbi:MAG: DUF4390 domain-containing protein [Magnetococcales bacterium]|nr:DUF4390 domain-containing protein [Magnetococcales bacterium]